MLPSTTKMQASGIPNVEENLHRILSDMGGSPIGPHYFTLNVKAIPAKLSHVRKFIREICNSYNIGKSECEDIVLAADEAMTNVIMHGYSREDQERGEADITVRLKIIKTGVIRFEMLDRGIRFTGKHVDRPDIMQNIRGEKVGGFGIYIIHSIMDRVNYRRMGGLNLFQAEKNVQLTL